jgi:hypothetical protein
MSEFGGRGVQSGSPIYQWPISLDGTRQEIAAIISHQAAVSNCARRIVP